MRSMTFDEDDGLSDGVGLDNDNDSSFDMSRDQVN